MGQSDFGRAGPDPSSHVASRGLGDLIPPSRGSEQHPGQGPRSSLLAGRALWNLSPELGPVARTSGGGFVASPDKGGQLLGWPLQSHLNPHPTLSHSLGKHLLHARDCGTERAWPAGRERQQATKPRRLRVEREPRGGGVAG